MDREQQFEAVMLDLDAQLRCLALLGQAQFGQGREPSLRERYEAKLFETGHLAP